MLIEPERCGVACDCGEVLVFYENPRYPGLNEPWLRRRSFLFEYVATSRVAQLAAIYEALRKQGAEVALKDGFIVIRAIYDGDLQRRPVVRVGVQVPTLTLDESGWSFIVGQVSERRRARAPQVRPGDRDCVGCRPRSGTDSDETAPASVVEMRERADAHQVRMESEGSG